MQRKRGLTARDRASGTGTDPVGRPVSPPPAPPPQPIDRRGPAWAQVAAPKPVPILADGHVLAGGLRRLIAWIIDLVVLFVLFLPVVWLFDQVLGPSATWRDDPLPSLVYADASALIGFLYWVGLWTGGRRTVGMRLLGIRVVSALDGGPVSLRAGVRRWLLFEGVPVLLGMVSDVGIWLGTGELAVIGSAAGMLWAVALLGTTLTSPTQQGLHDRFGRTYVVRG